MTRLHARQPKPRRAYRAPRLRGFGSIPSLTAGGSGPVNENMVGGMALMKQKL